MRAKAEDWRKKIPAFLADLSAVTRKHGIGVEACGCCDGIWVYEELEAGRYVVGSKGESLKWDNKA